MSASTLKAEALAELIEAVTALEESALRDGDVDCDIDIGPGDWGGQSATVKVSQFAAIYLARQLLQLASREAPGAHFHVDKASIATDTDHQLIFTRMPLA